MISVKYITNKVYKELEDEYEKLSVIFTFLEEQNKHAGNKLLEYNYLLQHRIISKQKELLRELKHKVSVSQIHLAKLKREHLQH